MSVTKYKYRVKAISEGKTLENTVEKGDSESSLPLSPLFIVLLFYLSQTMRIARHGVVSSVSPPSPPSGSTVPFVTVMVKSEISTFKLILI